MIIYYFLRSIDQDLISLNHKLQAPNFKRSFND